MERAECRSSSRNHCHFFGMESIIHRPRTKLAALRAVYCPPCLFEPPKVIAPPLARVRPLPSPPPRAAVVRELLRLLESPMPLPTLTGLASRSVPPRARSYGLPTNVVTLWAPSENAKRDPLTLTAGLEARLSLAEVT